jgi:hypothetical protein
MYSNSKNHPLHVVLAAVAMVAAGANCHQNWLLGLMAQSCPYPLQEVGVVGAAFCPHGTGDAASQ